jgi:hypothetical protein
MEVEELTVKLLAGMEPKETQVTWVKEVPVMVTEFPPAVVPVLGETFVTVGAGPEVAETTARVTLVGLYWMLKVGSN